MTTDEELIQAALRAKENAVAPFSKFPVGAALLTENGTIYLGCNIEVSSFGLTMCAERVALFAAITAGERKFRRLVISTDTEEFCPPCGACRQVLWDFAPNLELILLNRDGKKKEVPLAGLFPSAFGRDFLRGV